MIGVITVLARLVGFGRQVVFAHTVGTTCLGTAYTTANMVPNIIYDIVLGGALSSVVVPVLAGPAGGAAPAAGAEARRIASALLTWTVVLLVPVSAALALAAHPIVSALLSGATGCRPPRRGRHADADRLRAAGAAVRPGGRAVRDPAVAPALRRAGPGAAAVVAGSDRRVRRVRLGRRRLRQPARRAAAAGRVPAVRRNDARRARARARPPSSRRGVLDSARARRCGSRPGSPLGSAGSPSPG